MATYRIFRLLLRWIAQWYCWYYSKYNTTVLSVLSLQWKALRVKYKYSLDYK